MKKQRKKINLSLFISFFLLLLFIPYFPAQAQSQEIKVNLQIPGLTKECAVQDPDSEIEYCVSNFGEYISQFYLWFARVAGIFAVVMIAYGGYQWIFAQGNASKIESAKTTINGALIGLVLTLGAFLLLNTINPALVKFKSITLGNVDPDTLIECPTDADLVDLKKFFPNNNFLTISSNVKDPRVNKDMIKMLDEAAKELKERGYHLTITGAYRSRSYQDYLYNCYQTRLKTGACNCPEGCNEAAKSSCSAPHLTGKAIDACVSKDGDNSLCQMINKDYNYTRKEKPPYGEWQFEFQQIMHDSGFYRYCGEWWHFESKMMSPACGAGMYRADNYLPPQ